MTVFQANYQEKALPCKIFGDNHLRSMCRTKDGGVMECLLWAVHNDTLYVPGFGYDVTWVYDISVGWSMTKLVKLHTLNHLREQVIDWSKKMVGEDPIFHSYQADLPWKITSLTQQWERFDRANVRYALLKAVQRRDVTGDRIEQGISVIMPILGHEFKIVRNYLTDGLIIGR